MITADQIKPKVRGESDFLSWHLYRFLRKNPRYNRIYRAPDGVVYIGCERDGDWVYGARLIGVTCGDLKTWAYSPGQFRTPEWQDITDEFWTDYLTRGVCAIHNDLAHNWNEAGDTRTCEYCGKVERKITRTVQRVEVDWVAVTEEVV